MQGCRVPWKSAGVPRGLTITHKLEQGQVNLPLPRRALLEGDSVTSGGKDVPTADGHELTAFIPASLVIQDRRIVDESVQFPAMTKKKKKEKNRESGGQQGTILGPSSRGAI